MLSKYCSYDVDDDVLTDFVVCLILKISMNVTLVTTPVQQHKYVSISREALHAWILYSVTLLTSKLVTSEYAILWVRLHLRSFSHSRHILLNWNSRLLPPPLQSVYVFCWEPCLQGQTLHYSVPTHGLVVGAQCACRHLPDAGHHALPRRLLHLPDKIGQWRTRVLHESEYIRDEHVTTLSCRCEGKKHNAVAIS